MLSVGTVLRVAGQPVSPKLQPTTGWVVVSAPESGMDFQLARLERSGRIATVNVKNTETITLPVLARLIGQGRIDVTDEIIQIPQVLAVA